MTMKKTPKSTKAKRAVKVKQAPARALTLAERAREFVIAGDPIQMQMPSGEWAAATVTATSPSEITAHYFVSAVKVRLDRKADAERWRTLPEARRAMGVPEDVIAELAGFRTGAEAVAAKAAADTEEAQAAESIEARGSNFAQALAWLLLGKAVRRHCWLAGERIRMASDGDGIVNENRNGFVCRTATVRQIHIIASDWELAE